jgi:hypothetical protein
VFVWWRADVIMCIYVCGVCQEELQSLAGVRQREQEEWQRTALKDMEDKVHTSHTHSLQSLGKRDTSHWFGYR